jgi:phage baseplate assembly protein V
MNRTYGVVTATVVDRDDPNRQGRIRIRYGWMGDDAEGYWAPVSTLMAGSDRGAWFMPEIGDEVLCAFDQGDVAHPFVVGFLWNGEDKPPETDPQRRVIRSRNGHEVALYDPDPVQGDTGYVEITDAHGNSIRMANGRVAIRSIALLTIDAPSVTINGRVVLPVARPI